MTETTKDPELLEREILDPQKLQTLRLMLAMYNQGWKDALAHLQIATRQQETKFKREYKELLELAEEMVEKEESST